MRSELRKKDCFVIFGRLPMNFSPYQFGIVDVVSNALYRRSVTEFQELGSSNMVM